MITHKDLAVATPVSKPFSRAGWIYELKYDGFRALGAHDAGGELRLSSRRGTNLLNCFPEIGGCLEALPTCVLDGELVSLDDTGRPVFEKLSRRFRLKRQMVIAEASRTEPAVLFAFDLLVLRGKDLRRVPLLKRKDALKALLKNSDRIRYVEHIGEEGARLFTMAESLGIEGIVAKRADSLYYRGKESGWLKVKTSAGRAVDEERAKWDER